MPRSLVVVLDACVVSLTTAEATSEEARRLAPTAVRVLAEGVRSAEPGQREATCRELRSRGIDPEALDVANLNDEEILAFFDRAKTTSQ